MTINLKEIKEIIDSWDNVMFPKKDGPYIVRLVDESDLNGLVEFVDKNGNPRLQMPREDYEAIQEWGKNNCETQSNCETKPN